jgi:serine protease AprX
VALDPSELRRWLLGDGTDRRFTQDSPVMPDVWLAFGDDPAAAVDVLLSPFRGADAGALAAALREPLGSDGELAYNRAYVVVRVTLDELIAHVLPLSDWWQKEIAPQLPAAPAAGAAPPPSVVQRLGAPEREQGRWRGATDVPGDAVWLAGLVGRLSVAREAPPPGAAAAAAGPPGTDRVAQAGWQLMSQAAKPAADAPLLHRVHLNRQVRPAVWRSRVTVKADAATSLFGISCQGLRWAVIDSGIDATHPAFARKGALPASSPAAGSRVVATLDFTRLRGLFARAPGDTRLTTPGEERLDELQAWLDAGRSVDWSVLEPQLRISHDQGYSAPGHEHGTHVAGVLAAHWTCDEARAAGLALERDLVGICPDLELYDLRVLRPDGTGDEFAILAALQYVRWLNANSTVPVIHGVNLSVSLDHDVGAYACGRTPVCDECRRLVANGSVVVAAAGNQGQARFTAADGMSFGEGYRSVSITDPGNADAVITVGATHREQPHTYGVSYFSSRGPTGDGRLKPDLVAPGEKIVGPVPGAGLKTLDGTSQAAPHVSGAAALLLARHPELVGDPARVKELLCATATDLGRERAFQGAGLVDILRVLQAV